MSALRDPDRFEAWLHRLTVRACYSEARRARSRPTIDVDIHEITPAIEDGSIPLADRDELERGFRRLDPDQRAVIVLHFYLGIPLREAADVLGIPEGTAKSRLHRAIRHLRADLVLCSGEGKRWTKHIVRAALRTICRRAGLRVVGAHVLRHTFCSHLAMRGAVPKAIQELAGHTTLTVTLRYMHLAPSALRDAIRLLDDRSWQNRANEGEASEASRGESLT